MGEGVPGWLHNPAVQAGIVPFVLAALIALPLARSRWLVLAAGSGLAVLLALTVGFEFVPLTSVRRVTLVVMLAWVAGLALAAARAPALRTMVLSLSVGAALASLWVAQRFLEQSEGWAAWWMALGVVALVLFSTFATLIAVRADALRASVVGTALGWGSGALAILGASALLGQIGIALGSACAATAGAQLLRQHVSRETSWTVVLPIAVGAPLIVVLSVVTGQLRGWHALPLSLVAPAAALINVTDRQTWVRAALQGLAALVPVGAAIALAVLATAGASAAG